MKCLILAGGKGERLWPLSRKDFPKQFIQVQKNHSIFQETIARNLPYCDEFIIITNYEYRYIVANQMEAFQGVPYRCVFEEEARKTTAAVTLACLSLQPSEYVFVVAADHLINTSEMAGSYKESILKAKEEAADGYIVLFCKHADEIDSRFGYVLDDTFFEKPDKKIAKQLKEHDIWQNIGLLIFQNGVFLNEMRDLQNTLLSQCRTAFEKRSALHEGVFYSAEILQTIEPVSIEKSLLEKTKRLCAIRIGFPWDDIGSLEDLEKTDFNTVGVGITYDCQYTTVLNQSPNQAVVVNDLDNLFVVNTADAVYVGRRGKSHLLKEILHDNPELVPYSDNSTVTYRPWGYYEQIKEEDNYRLRKVVILPGKTISEHTHNERKENWTVIEGVALIVLSGNGRTYGNTESFEIPAGEPHQISNSGEKNLILLETAMGEILHGGDLLPACDTKITETELGLQLDAMVRLSPAFKDYLWGGTKLRDLYGKNCDFDVIAESWELSAHPAGNSIVASGRHKGLSFSQYLDIVGRNVLGWKCMQGFPLLIKYIDAKQNLSVQVHPNDDYALENENEYGKNEMWYVVDAEPGAGLYVGFNRDTDRAEVENRIADGSIMHILNFYPTKPGDIFFIPAGTVHAIGAGNLICEIQQSSNSTYRLYDYDRKDKFGNPRELHLRKALDVLNYKKYIPECLDQEDGKIRCKYFEVVLEDICGEIEIPLTDDSFHSFICLRGEGTLSLNGEVQIVKAGDSIFMPARNGLLHISGNLAMALTKI